MFQARFQVSTIFFLIITKLLGIIVILGLNNHYDIIINFKRLYNYL